MFVNSYMTKNPVTISAKTAVRDAFFLLKKYGFRQFPVVEEGRLVGIVTDRDLRTAIFRPELRVEDIMTLNPLTVKENERLESAILKLRENKFNALPVISENGELCGIITVTDVLDALIELLGSREASERFRVEISSSFPVPLWEIVKTVEQRGGEVLSVLSERKDKKSYYICLKGGDFQGILKELEEKGVVVKHIEI